MLIGSLSHCHSGSIVIWNYHLFSLSSSQRFERLPPDPFRRPTEVLSSSLVVDVGDTDTPTPA